MTARMRGLLLALAFTTLIVPLAAEADPPLTARDNDHASWARQVIPVLYGRKPRGYAEIRLLAELAAEAGRGPVVAALMASDEFVEHWTDVFLEHLRVNREGEKDLSKCFTRSAGHAGKSKALAEHIQRNGPGSTFAGGEFTMGDVVRSSILLDDVSPIFLAHLFPMVTKPRGGSDKEKQADLLGGFDTVFLNRKGACLACHNSSFSVTDHTSHWPRAHPIPGHFEEALYNRRIGPKYPQEVSTFLRVDVAPPDAGPDATRPWGLSNCGGFREPTTPDPELVVEDTSTTPPTQLTLKPSFAGISGVSVVSIFHVESQLRRGVGKLRESRKVTRTVSPADVAYCTSCKECDGLSDELEFASEHDTRQKEAFGIIEDKCGDCHVRGGNRKLLSANADYAARAKFFYEEVARAPAEHSNGCVLVTPGAANQSFVWRRLFEETRPASGDLCTNTGDRMPWRRPELDAVAKGKLEAWISNMPRNAGCRACKSRRLLGCPTPEHPEMAALKVEPDESFAAMVAASFVNRVWTEAMGYPLTIANYFPRSVGQGERLTTLTEAVFIKEGFSLKKLLAAILAVPPDAAAPFNRSPPSRRSVDAKDVYDWPLELDPWSELDPRRPPVAEVGYSAEQNPQNHRNAMTEGIRRYPAYTLIRSAYTALGWPVPDLLVEDPFDTTTTELAKESGLFYTDAAPGFRGIDLQSLLAWETHLAGCRRHQKVKEDWIDRLRAEVVKVNAANPRRPLTRREVLAAVKDWLIGDGSIAAGEESMALAALFGWTGEGALDQPFETAIQNEGDPSRVQGDRLRRFCAVLLQSPQFQLAGMTPGGLTPPPPLEPRLRRCNDGPCSRRELCEAIAPEMAKVGYTVTCQRPGAPPAFTASARPTRGTPAASVTKAQLDEVCPPGRCYLMTLPPGCRGDVAACVRALPPCDPRSDSCGGPTDLVGRLKALQDGAVLVVELEGARLVETSDGRLQSRLARTAVKAKRGDVLKGGDVLLLRPGAVTWLDRLPPLGGAAAPALRARPGSSDRWKIAVDKKIAGTRPRPAPGPADEGPSGDEVVLLVAGPSQRAAWQSAQVLKPVPTSEIEGALLDSWRRYGEAGVPLGPKGGMRLEPDAMQRYLHRNDVAIEKARRIFEALKAEQARRR